MPLETPSFISDMNASNPPGSDNVLQGDDHIRNMKAAIKATLPNATRAQYFPRASAKTTDYTILATDMEAFFNVDATGGAVAMTLPTLGASNDGWFIHVTKTDSGANAVNIIGTINGAANIALTAQYQTAYVWWDGSAWKALVVSGGGLVTALGALTAPAAGDLLTITDISDNNILKKITLENLFKVIPDITQLAAAPALDDELVIYDTSATAAKSITLTDFVKFINVLTTETTIVAGDFLPFYDTSEGAANKVDFGLVNPFGLQLYHLTHEEAANTSAGTFTSGAFRTRTLNTERTNQITGASLASNQVTLPAGTYYIEATAPAYQVNGHTTKLRNTTDASDTLIGTTVRADGDSVTISQVNGRFTIAAQKVFELQHRCETTGATTGFGRAGNFGVTEVYADVRIWKLA